MPANFSTREGRDTPRYDAEFDRITLLIEKEIQRAESKIALLEQKFNTCYDCHTKEISALAGDVAKTANEIGELKLAVANIAKQQEALQEQLANLNKLINSINETILPVQDGIRSIHWIKRIVTSVAAIFAFIFSSNVIDWIKKIFTSGGN